MRLDPSIALAIALIDANERRDAVLFEPLDQALLAFERQLIESELESASGVIAHAAQALGVGRTALSKRIKRLGLKRPPGGG